MDRQPESSVCKQPTHCGIRRSAADRASYRGGVVAGLVGGSWCGAHLGELWVTALGRPKRVDANARAHAQRGEVLEALEAVVEAHGEGKGGDGGHGACVAVGGRAEGYGGGQGTSGWGVVAGG